MATKAELETELAKLRGELKSLRQSPKGDGAAAGDAAKETPDPAWSSEGAHSDGPASDNAAEDILHSLQDGDFEGVLHQLVEELEGLPARKPLLTAFGALVVGYLIGRSGSKG